MKLIRSITAYLVLCFVLLLVTDRTVAQESLSRKHGLRIKTVYIDPAYGGKEGGPRLEKNNYGKNVTLLIAQKLQILLTEAGFTVHLSREGDIFVPLETRTSRAKVEGADIYLAIQVSNRGNDCIRLLTPKPPKERKPIQSIETKKLSELNREINEIFNRLQVDVKLEESLYLADKLRMKLVPNQYVNCIRIESLYDYILLNSAMPAVIIDFGVSKQSDKRPYLVSAGTQDQIAAAIEASIKAYSEERDSSSSQ